jgi:hypothetical protein
MKEVLTLSNKADDELAAAIYDAIHYDEVGNPGWDLTPLARISTQEVRGNMSAEFEA